MNENKQLFAKSDKALEELHSVFVGGCPWWQCSFVSPLPGAFFLYSSLALLGFFFCYGCLPETKGRRLEEIEALFENQLCSCGASDSDEGRQVEYIRVKGSNYHLSDNDASDVD